MNNTLADLENDGTDAKIKKEEKNIRGESSNTIKTSKTSK